MTPTTNIERPPARRIVGEGFEYRGFKIQRERRGLYFVLDPHSTANAIPARSYAAALAVVDGILEQRARHADAAANRPRKFIEPLVRVGAAVAQYARDLFNVKEAA